MKKVFSGFAAAGLVAASVALAAPANASCAGGYTPWGGGQTCDGPVVNGWFERCVYVVVLGFGGPNCYMVDINNMAGQHIPNHIGPW